MIAAAPFIQARNYTRASSRAIKWIVLHTMEAPEKPNTARAVARWFAGPNAPRASAHYCVDATEIVQCVKDADVAWHAPGANREGIGIEHAGFARQTDEEWADEYSRAVLERSAVVAASICCRYGIPIEFRDATALVRDEPGITTHAEVSLAWMRSTHNDPGRHFPMQDYLALVRAVPIFDHVPFA